MIYIDNRVLIPFVLPFVLLAMVRLLWFVAGAEWSAPDVAAGLCSFVGIVVGAAVTAVLFADGTEIGGFWIGRRK